MLRDFEAPDHTAAYGLWRPSPSPVLVEKIVDFHGGVGQVRWYLFPLSFNNALAFDSFGCHFPPFLECFLVSACILSFHSYSLNMWTEFEK
jgi:hypothetical protein